MQESLVVNEIYLSLQGESTWAGLPCVFVRLTACNLRCSYCDTAYAFTQGRKMERAEILARVGELAAPYDAARRGEVRLPLVELTGGEPLLQAACLPLMAGLCDAGFVVLLETNGALDISLVDSRVHRIMDLKCPSSGEVEQNRWENLRYLTPTDEIKFVIGSEEDYAWAKHILEKYSLPGKCPLLFSWASPLTGDQQSPVLKPTPRAHQTLARQQLAEYIIRDALPVRFQMQLHKVIWAPDARGV